MFCFFQSSGWILAAPGAVSNERKLALLNLGLSPLKGQSKLLKAVMFTFSWYPEPCPKHRFDLQEHVCRHVTGQLSLASHIAGRPHSVALRQVSSQEHSQVNRQTDSYSARRWSDLGGIKRWNMPAGRRSREASGLETQALLGTQMTDSEVISESRVGLGRSWLGNWGQGGG